MAFYNDVFAIIKPDLHINIFYYILHNFFLNIATLILTLIENNAFYNGKIKTNRQFNHTITPI